jgi:LuxR family transcriptional regulator
MPQRNRINEQLQRLVVSADWKFALGLRIRFNHPTLLYQTYPEAWVAYYAQNGLLFADPTVMWGMTNTGVCDWRDLEHLDAAGVLRQARDFGLVHGIVVSVGDVTQRSIGFFATTDVPIRGALRDTAQEVMAELHEATEGVTDMSAGEVAALAALNDNLRGVRA